MPVESDVQVPQPNGVYSHLRNWLVNIGGGQQRLQEVVSLADSNGVDISTNLQNLDVALSTRTKPADQQHAIIDSGSVTAVQGSAGTAAWPVKADLQGLAVTRTKIDIAASGDNTIVAAVAAQTIRIYKLWFLAKAAVDLTFWDGPSVSGTKMTGTLSLAANEGFAFDGDSLPDQCSSGNAFIINLGAAVQVSGRIWYTQA